MGRHRHPAEPEGGGEAAHRGGVRVQPRLALDVRRFTREAAVTAGLVHPSVPAIFDAGTYDGGLYLVMELVDGCTIGDLAAEQGPLPVGWAAGIAGQVAAVLAIAHEREVLHRDIKPQNVMLTRDGTVKVLDFGVAAVISQRITSTGVTVGTPGFIAPEQLHNLPATPQTDLYALGCLLYEMLAGEPVFTATSPAGLIRMHLEQAPPPLRRRDVPPQLESLLWQLLGKDPAARPPGARQVYDRLLPFVAPAGPLGDIDPGGLARYRHAALRAAAGQAFHSGSRRNRSGLSGAGPTVSRCERPVHRACSSRHEGAEHPRQRGLDGPAQPVAAAGHRCSADSEHACRSAISPPAISGCPGSPPRPLTWPCRWWRSCSSWSGQNPSSGPLPVVNDIGLCFLFALWPAAVTHALWVNFRSRLPLLRTMPR